MTEDEIRADERLKTLRDCIALLRQPFKQTRLTGERHEINRFTCSLIRGQEESVASLLANELLAEALPGLEAVLPVGVRWALEPAGSTIAPFLREWATAPELIQRLDAATERLSHHPSLAERAG